MSRTIIILTGPTASGKTAAAVELARYYKTEIINADSRQCFKELSIGVARPSVVELNAVPHHFIASHSVTEEVNAAVFAAYAREKAEQIFQSKPVLILTGGTGLYIRAFTDGLDPVPATAPEIREQITSAYQQNGISWLQETLREKDPLFASQGEMENPQRMMRALEVITQTGQSILSFHSNKKNVTPYRFIRTGLQLPREILRERIAQRVHQMMAAGLEEEVRSLQPYRHLNALQTVGYEELFEYFDGKLTRDQAIQQIIDHTRQYAKRQMTWLKKYGNLDWFDPGNTERLRNYIDTNLK